MTDYNALRAAVVAGEQAEVEQLVGAALAAGAPAEQILQEGLIPAMGEVGQQFETGACFVPEMLVAARAMKAGVELLRPALSGAGLEPKYTIIIGTVKGDLHDVGKNLVGLMMEGSGFKVVDLGVDVTPAAFVEAVRAGADLIGLSALLTTTMPNMVAVIKALKAAGLRENVKVLVGGAPLNQDVADRIGADGFAPDAGAAVRKALTLVGAEA
ncbi:MAG: corrinoid protein [Anaerolineales bacterium]|nr:corrinoid protein [Anaerolineales bacterium]